MDFLVHQLSADSKSPDRQMRALSCSCLASNLRMPFWTCTYSKVCWWHSPVDLFLNSLKELFASCNHCHWEGRHHRLQCNCHWLHYCSLQASSLMVHLGSNLLQESHLSSRQVKNSLSIDRWCPLRSCSSVEVLKPLVHLLGIVVPILLSEHSIKRLRFGEVPSLLLEWESTVQLSTGAEAEVQNRQRIHNVEAGTVHLCQKHKSWSFLSSKKVFHFWITEELRTWSGTILDQFLQTQQKLVDAWEKEVHRWNNISGNSGEDPWTLFALFLHLCCKTVLQLQFLHRKTANMNCNCESVGTVAPALQLENVVVPILIGLGPGQVQSTPVKFLCLQSNGLEAQRSAKSTSQPGSTVSKKLLLSCLQSYNSNWVYKLKEQRQQLWTVVERRCCEILSPIFLLFWFLLFSLTSLQLHLEEVADSLKGRSVDWIKLEAPLHHVADDRREAVLGDGQLLPLHHCCHNLFVCGDVVEGLLLHQDLFFRFHSVLPGNQATYLGAEYAKAVDVWFEGESPRGKDFWSQPPQRVTALRSALIELPSAVLCQSKVFSSLEIESLDWEKWNFITWNLCDVISILLNHKDVTTCQVSVEGGVRPRSQSVNLWMMLQTWCKWLMPVATCLKKLIFCSCDIVSLFDSRNFHRSPIASSVTTYFLLEPTRVPW